MLNMLKKKQSCFFRIHAVMPIAMLLCCCFPSESTAGNRNKLSNTEKIRLIHQTLRTQLKEKKLNLQAEDIFQQVGSQIPLESMNSDDVDSLKDKMLPQEKAERERLEKEARIRYPAFLIGDNLKLSGKNETVTGRYNKRTRRGIWIGVRSIPWTDMSPECVAQFYYKTLINLRYRNDLLYVNGKWCAAKEYINQQVDTFQTTLKEKSHVNPIIQIIIYALGCILFGSIGIVIGKSRPGKASFVIGGIIGILLGLFISFQAVNLIRARKVNKAIAVILEQIVDPKEYNFNRIEEIQILQKKK